ncbi:hypothetical protein LK540_03030 [Massilia sp. IC2-278]|jgi:hypothetical protein|uniref:hypothetical protein n=1 Tax=Massilia sp. IC2-278 TaxID=2887200 RepID=UPI001E63573B|nr:hypothetical protein [Massilia sp. IC2-278]MCC2959401.1 hypothetical protein [Massilia sp. IC2-278]
MSATMPPMSHWIGQYAFAAGSMFALLLVVDVLVRGEAFARAWPSALAWAAVASALFIGRRYYNMRKGLDCAVCERLDKK